MNNQDFNTVLDVSAIIWSEENYNEQYYTLLPKLSSLLIKIEKANTKVLMRKELLKEIVNAFPYANIPNELWAIGSQVYSFFGNIGSVLIGYEDSILTGITSFPNQIKPYFTEMIETEVNYLISEIHSKNSSQNVFFTFSSLFESAECLQTIVEHNTCTHCTIISDSGNSLEDFLSGFKLIFEHHAKHDKAEHKTREKWNETENKRDFESQLSCNNGDSTLAQELLDLRYNKCYGNNYFYSYDTINEVYVVFRKTERNIYHGYDMYDIERVPQEVKNHFRIWKY